MITNRRLSASALKSLEQCSYAFYLSRYLNLPERVWGRTSTGTVVHLILECLRREKHRHHHDFIKATKSINGCFPVLRLIKSLQVKYNISDELIADIGPMVVLVLTQTNFLDLGAIETFDPEHEFTLNLSGGAIIRGFIDRLARYEDGFIITDYKSQSKRFTADDLTNNFQALVYQLYIWKTFKKFATVEFILLRHPPTSRTPDKHIQRVHPATEAQLEGFEYYLEHIYQTLQSFGLKEAHESFCQDFGFCKNVCSFFQPFEYVNVTKKLTGELVGNFAVDKVPNIKDDEVCEIRRYNGCPKHR